MIMMDSELAGAGEAAENARQLLPCRAVPPPSAAHSSESVTSSSFTRCPATGAGELRPCTLELIMMLFLKGATVIAKSRDHHAAGVSTVCIAGSAGSHPASA